eukprot:3441656-Alexandrium_andersonii.AAC.1
MSSPMPPPARHLREPHLGGQRFRPAGEAARRFPRFARPCTKHGTVLVHSFEGGRRPRPSAPSGLPAPATRPSR